MSEPAFADDARLSYQIRTMLKLGNYPQLDMMQEWLAKAQEMEDALAVPEGLTEAGARAIDEACSAPEPAPPKALRYLIARKFGVEMEDVSTEQAQAIAAIIKACGGQVPGDHTSTVSFDTEKFKRAFERMRKEASTPEPEPWAEAERVLEAAVTSRKLRSWDVGQHGTYSEYTMLWPSDSGAYCHSLNHLSRRLLPPRRWRSWRLSRNRNRSRSQASTP